MKTCRFEPGFGAIEFSAETGEKRTATCFCDPYVSNQKAGAENMNGQLRRHFPKKGNVDENADEYVAQSFGNINSAPLKSLGGEIARAIEEFVKGQAKPRLGNGLRPLFSARAETGRYRQVLPIHFQVTRFFFRDNAIQGGHKYSCGIHLPGKAIRRRL